MLNFEKGDGAWDDLKNQSKTRIVSACFFKTKGSSLQGRPSCTKSAELPGTQRLLSGEAGTSLQTVHGAANQDREENLQTRERMHTTGQLAEDETSEANVVLNTIQFNEWKLPEGMPPWRSALATWGLRATLVS